jgi:AcrR family transcriptional regulator
MQALPSTAPRRTQAERRQASERNLLEAAAALIAEQGVAAATLERVGARAGYSRGLATQKFGSKQGLIEALIAALQVRLDAKMVDRHADTMPGLPAILAFTDIFLADLESDTELRAYFMLLASTVADGGPSRALFAASHDAVRVQLAALVVRGQADGTVRAGVVPDHAATLVGSLLLGLSVQSLVEPGLDLATMRATAAGMVRESLR